MNQNEERIVMLTGKLNQAMRTKTNLDADITLIKAEISEVQEKVEEEEANDRSTLSPQAQIILDEINCLTCED